MGFDFAAHGRRKPSRLDGVATIPPASRAVARLSLTALPTRGCSLFHGVSDVIAHLHFRKIKHVSVLISNSRTNDRTACIHPQRERLGVALCWLSKQLDGKGCTP